MQERIEFRLKGQPETLVGHFLCGTANAGGGKIGSQSNSLFNIFPSCHTTDKRGGECVARTAEESFRILGVPETAPADEVKKAWRKKVREIHPDRMQGRGMSAEIIDRAKEEIQKINKAYETIRKLKGW